MYLLQVMKKTVKSSSLCNMMALLWVANMVVMDNKNLYGFDLWTRSGVLALNKVT